MAHALQGSVSVFFSGINVRNLFYSTDFYSNVLRQKRAGGAAWLN